MSEVAEVDADLVGAPGVERAADEGIGSRGVFDEVIGDGFLTGRGADDGHAESVGGVASDVGVDGALSGGGRALDYGEVDFAGGAVGELGTEVVMGCVAAGDHEAAAGFLVEPVHDAGSGDSADAAECSEAVEEGIDDRAVLVAVGWVDDHARCLVEDGEEFVFEEDFEGKVLRGGFRGAVGRDGSRDDVARVQGETWLRGFASGEDGSFAQERLDAGAGERGEAASEELVESGSGIRRFCGERERFLHGLAACGQSRARMSLPFQPSGSGKLAPVCWRARRRASVIQRFEAWISVSSPVLSGLSW